MLLEAGKNLLKKFVKKGAIASIGIARDAVRGTNIRQAITNRVGEALGVPQVSPKNIGTKRTRGKKKKMSNPSKGRKKPRMNAPNKDIFS